MADQTPRYLTIVEPEYEAMEAYTEVQEEGISSSWLGRIVAIIAISTALVLVVVYQYIGLQRTATNDRVSDDVTYMEQQKHAEQAATKLEKYGVVDAAQGKYQIPVQRAVELVLRDAKNAPVAPATPAPAPAKPATAQ